MNKQDNEEEDMGPDPEQIVKYHNDSIVLLGQVINKVPFGFGCTERCECQTENKSESGKI